MHDCQDGGSDDISHDQCKLLLAIICAKMTHIDLKLKKCHTQTVPK